MMGHLQEDESNLVSFEGTLTRFGHYDSGIKFLLRVPNSVSTWTILDFRPGFNELKSMLNWPSVWFPPSYADSLKVLVWLGQLCFLESISN